MNAVAELSPAEENAVARRNLVVYLFCQSISAAAIPMNIALGGLAGSYLLGPDKSLATAPVTSYTVGVAIGTAVANAIMRVIGRRSGFMIGNVVGAVGMLATGTAIVWSSFWLFCAALAINGLAGGFVQQYRFAAADRGTADFKPKAISWIMAGGLVAAVLGPQIIIATRNLTDPVPFAGAFYVGTILFVLSFLALVFLRPAGASPAQAASANLPSRSLGEIIAQPRFIVAVLCGTSTYALMSFVMTAAPLAMVGCGHTQVDSTLGIQWHVMAMFGPSFFTGHLIARFGKERIVAAGLAILVACAIIAMLGIALWHFWLSLILLGVGWNFGFIGATAMVTDTYRPQEKAKAQGANDFILFSTVAFASLMSGLALNGLGEGVQQSWWAINGFVFPVAAICLGALYWLARRERTLQPAE